MQGKDFLFCLTDKNYNFWHVENNVVYKKTQPYFLEFAPDGWQDVGISNIRNKNYWGVDRSVTVPLKYLQDAATILKYITYTLGVNEGVFLSIAAQRLDFDKPNGTVNLSTLVTDVDNNITITADPGTTVYFKLTPTSTTDVYLYQRDGNTSYFYTSLLDGNAKVLSVLIPAEGYSKLNLNFSGDTIDIAICNSNGNAAAEYGFWYKQIFRGEVDLSTFVHDGSKVSASTLESGLAKYLKANEGTVYEFPVNVPDAIRVKMDGINLHEALNYQPINALPVDYSAYGTNFFLPVTYLSNEGNSVGILMQSQSLESVSGLSWTDKLAKINLLLQDAGSKAISIQLTGKIEFTCTKMVSSPAWAMKIRFLRSMQDIANQNDYQIISTAAMIVGQTYSADINVTIPIGVNEKLFMEGIFFGGSGSEAEITFTENNSIKMAFITRADATYISALRPQYLFSQLMNKVTEGNFPAELSAFLLRNENTVFTSWNALRGLDDATIKISLKDFFKHWDSEFSVGLNEGDTVDIDEKEELIDTVNKIILNEPKQGTFKVSIAKDYLFNELDIGYPEIGSDVGTLNGNEEFNTKFVFSLGATLNPAVLDKISPIITSCYTIENIRVTQVNKDTTSYSNDNSTCALAIDSTLQPANGDIPAHYLLDRSLNAGATGLLEPTSVFNIPFSPKRMINNNGGFIRSSLYWPDTQVLKFISSSKNNKMVAGGITENADVVIGILANRFFHPVLFDFDIDPPDDLEDMLDINPLQLIEFPFQGNTFHGILQKVSIAPSSRAAQAYQLLSYITNDLTQLIDYYGQ